MGWASRKWETWRGWKNLNWKNDSANGDWPWRARLAEKTRADGSTPRWAPIRQRSRSATSITYNEDTADLNQLEATLTRLSEMVGRRLREATFYARTIQLKLRYKDFTTITRAHASHAAGWRNLRAVRNQFHKNWKRGVHASRWESRLHHLRRRRSRLVCSKVGASSAGRRPWQPPTACATGLANQAYRWQPACGEASANAPPEPGGAPEKTRPREEQNRSQKEHWVRSPIVE